MRVQFPPVLHVVVIEKVLDHVKRVVEGGVIRMIIWSVLDQILEAETVLLDPGHRLVQEILQRQRLTLLLTLQRPQLDRSFKQGSIFLL